MILSHTVAVPPRMILSHTVAVPRSVLTRDHIDPVALASFERVTGIFYTRRWHGSTLSLILEALHASDIGERADIGAVIVVTQSPDRLSPCMAIDVHRFLELPSHVPAFDVNQSCCGFLYGLWLASQLCTGPVLLICADKLRYAKTPTEALIFSDAASVTLFCSEFENLGEVDFFNDGDGAEKLYSKMDGSMEMEGGAVFDFVSSEVPRMIRRFEERCGKSDVLCQHQANLAIMHLVEKRTGYLGIERTLHTISRYGNCSMVSIPVALASCEPQILGKKVLLAGYGAGWAAAVTQIEWPEKPVSRLVEI